MKVEWSGNNLQINGGDEIVILRGFGDPKSGQVEATRIYNKTRRTVFKSSVEGVLSTRMPHDFTPPILGYAKSVVVSGSHVSFTLEEKAPPIVSGILRECAKFIDPKLYERCKDKDYHDVVTNAFPILEDKIRARLGVDPSYSGQRLIDYAFNPNTGRLILGETQSERQALHLLFKGAIGFLRNPPSHRITEEESNTEAFEIICMIDLLLRIVDKAELLPRVRKIPTRDRSTKAKELPKARIEIRREHSMKIKDEALKPWLTNAGNYCKIDTVYSEDADKMVGVEPKDPIDLDFFEFAESHLESKYSDVMNAWEELKRATSEQNKDLAIFMEKIRKLTIKRVKIPFYYSNLRRRVPKEYITLDRFVDSIYTEMKLRSQADGESMIGEPKITPVIIGDEKFHELEWGGYRLVRSRDEREVELVKFFIKTVIGTPRFRKEVDALIRKEDEKYRMKLDSFETKIKDVIKSIELGKILEGECRFCP